MAEWSDIARDNLKAAQTLADQAHFRSCTSRAYYAAFSAISFALRAYAPFPRGRETPPHHMVPTLIETHLTSLLTAARLQRVKAALRRLYNDRINADYRSALTIDAGSALRSRQDAYSVCVALGVVHAPGA